MSRIGYRTAYRALERSAALLDIAAAARARAPRATLDAAPFVARAVALLLWIEGPLSDSEPAAAPHVAAVRILASRHLSLDSVPEADNERLEAALEFSRAWHRRARVRARTRASHRERLRERRRRVRAWIFRMLAVTVGVVLSLGIAEMGFRVRASAPSPEEALRRAAQTHPPAPSEECATQPRQAGLGEIVRPSLATDVVYELKPNVDTCFYHARTTTNDAGFRATKNYEKPKPAGVYRILLLGDSYAFGESTPVE